MKKCSMIALAVAWWLMSIVSSSAFAETPTETVYEGADIFSMTISWNARAAKVDFITDSHWRIPGDGYIIYQGERVYFLPEGNSLYLRNGEKYYLNIARAFKTSKGIVTGESQLLRIGSATQENSRELSLPEYDGEIIQLRMPMIKLDLKEMAIGINDPESVPEGIFLNTVFDRGYFDRGYPESGGEWHHPSEMVKIPEDFITRDWGPPFPHYIGVGFDFPDLENNRVIMGSGGVYFKMEKNQ